MENRIHLLSPDLINKIAAGEVVERPASIAKELLENAVDSGATEIILNLENGGLDAISVNDNGLGMNKLEAASALQQHATSKISKPEDLFSISTLGFRGEALASIASISEVSIHSFNGSDSPVLVIANEHEIKSEMGDGRSQGTTVTASKIFHNVPARRKFLKTETTEFKYILETFINVVIAQKDISFKLIRDKKTILNLPTVNDIWQRISTIFPKLEKSHPISINYDDPQTRITGYIEHPNTAGSNANEQYIFINDRYIKNSLITKAVKEGFGTALMRDFNPTFFLFLQISNDIIDINVHPRKLEVRFSDPGRIFSTIKRAVSAAVNKKLTTELQENFSFSSDKISAPRPINSEKIKSSLDFSKHLLENTQMLSRSYQSPIKIQPNRASELTPIQNITPEDHETLSIQINEISQVFNTYLVFSQNNKLLFVDQHAAAERVNFEKITETISLDKTLSSQELLIPETLPLSSSEVLTVNNEKALFHLIGFSFSFLTANKIQITAIPQILANKNPLITFNEILAELKTSEANYSSRWRTIQDKLIATLACHASIRAGQRLSPIEAHKLILDLFTCKLPYSCPHGRPIIWELEREQLEKNFKRKL